MANNDWLRGFGIDVARESMLSFSEAARYVGKLKGQSKGVAVATLHRWASKGCRGVVLPTICVGGARCTSKEALQSFFVALTRAKADLEGAIDAGHLRGAVLGRDGDVDAVLRRAGIVKALGREEL